MLADFFDNNLKTPFVVFDQSLLYTCKRKQRANSLLLCLPHKSLAAFPVCDYPIHAGCA